ncbi:MAG: CopD family protein [Kiritimatiellae bacterium]|nr:CopD family protein [Kiritimatiellia bacterium]MCO5062343.1 CopD family protein [Kiritimatiellia bacterium]MCO5068590.1 CopD family protein [Kiritimatiellia bacterium]
MSTSVYAVSIIVHILAAATWIGGMLFMIFSLIPAVRRLDDFQLRARLIRETGIRFRLVGWISLAVLFVSGLTNLATRGIPHAALLHPPFWNSGYGRMLAAKIIIFLVILAVSAIHDWHIGPRASAASLLDAHAPEAIRARRLASQFGRLNLLLALTMLTLGVLLSRGLTG